MIGIADQVQDLQPREMKNAPSSAASPSFIEQIEFTPLDHDIKLRQLQCQFFANVYLPILSIIFFLR